MKAYSATGEVRLQLTSAFGRKRAFQHLDTAAEDKPIERRPVERRIGCASVVPAALIGVAGLADYAGPTGWRGFSEFLGWAAICVAVGFGVGLLLAQWRQQDWRRYVAVPSTLATVAAFTYAPYWLGLGAPMTAKVLFTTSLQVVGTAVPVALIIIAVFAGVRRRN